METKGRQKITEGNLWKEIKYSNNHQEIPVLIKNKYLFLKHGKAISQEYTTTSVKEKSDTIRSQA
jgi:hypothetical protein